MTYKLIVSKDVHFDIDGIVNYMVNKLQNQTAAVDFLDDVEKSYKNIIQNPMMYSSCDDERMKGYRKIPIKNYLILYSVDEKQKTVTVIRIIYGGRNYVELV